MKKLLLTLLLLSISSCAYASINNSNSACSYASINLATIAKIESNNNPLAYNRNSGATGMYQITPIVVKEYNNTFRSDLRIKDMFNSEIALTVSNWYINSKIPEYFRVYKIKDTIENRLWAYNAGIGLLKKGIKPLETRNYITKYNKLNYMVNIKQRGGKMKINDKKYCKFLVGKHDIKSQEYWSNYVNKKFGKEIDPYWSTEINFYNNNELLDVLWVREDVRFKNN